MDTKNKITWKNIKSKIEKEDKSELLKLISILYSLNKENKIFLNMKYSSEEISLESLKNEITKYINPSPMSHQKINIVKAKKVISNYYKATKDELGKLELMILFFEEGIDQLTNCDGAESYYDALISMFEKIVKELEKHSENEKIKYYKRLRKDIDSTNGLGYGFYDILEEVFEEIF